MSSIAPSASTFAKGAAARTAKGGSRGANRDAAHTKAGARVVARAGADDGSADRESASSAYDDAETRQKLVSGIAAASLLANVALVPVAQAAEAIAEVYQTAQATDLPAQVKPEFPRFDDAVPLSGPVADIADLSLDELYGANKAKRTARDDVLAAAQDAARVEAGERGGGASFRRRQSDERDARARERRRGPARLDRR
mmetsp:Transcript_12850/g.53869  ORF Transcript_12850/g.53869 Transcript_12850/m.53869 type:complete len:199 (-) Transcript_12850:1587-2183(-)